jgi:hypothetical protein
MAQRRWADVDDDAPSCNSQGGFASRSSKCIDAVVTSSPGAAASNTDAVSGSDPEAEIVVTCDARTGHEYDEWRAKMAPKLYKVGFVSAQFLAESCHFTTPCARRVRNVARALAYSNPTLISAVGGRKEVLAAVQTEYIRQRQIASDVSEHVRKEECRDSLFGVAQIVQTADSIGFDLNFYFEDNWRNDEMCGLACDTIMNELERRRAKEVIDYDQSKGRRRRRK